MKPSASAEIRKRYLFTGIVQGVGFRPFIYRLAVENRLAGFVQNRTDGVMVEVEGRAEAVERFRTAVQAQLPPLAQIVAVTEEEMPATGAASFVILASADEGGINVHLSPDMAVCEDCLRELFDPADRRYRYPFINCTNCGPRLTIIHDIPYDRANTAMACFPLCEACRREYEDPADRRFHAEPNACGVCGPALRLLAGDGRPIETGDPLSEAAALLRQGRIVAIKGIGGFHLAADAASDEALKRLRERKFREEKPFALMVRDVAAVRALVSMDAAEEALLLSPQRPIVLMSKCPDAPISALVAPGMATLGIMLPYTPLQHLLLAEGFGALVMTSANQTDEPICIGNREAVGRLEGIADAFLVHNRDILVRCDDSIARVAGGEPRMMRRARGFAPRPVLLKENYPDVLALGPQLKATVCVLKGDTAFLSPHIGDMETPQARDFFHENIALMQRITECAPGIVAYDLHPGYYATRHAQTMTGVRLEAVQHHHAHIVSCMAENGLSGEVLGLAMDGTGYGTDGHVWGGELLAVEARSFRRLGHLREFRLPGGEKAVREPWRIAVSLLRETYGAAWSEYAQKLGLVPSEVTYDLMEKVLSQGINSPLTSSLGRLFDGVAALLGLRRSVSFEGQAAMELEALAVEGRELSLDDIAVQGRAPVILDPAPLVRGIVEGILDGTEPARLASAFHRALVRALTGASVAAREATGLDRVCLSGGCFQNRILLEGCLEQLQAAGFAVFHHRHVPTNDGGIALGQALCAGARARDGKL